MSEDLVYDPKTKQMIQDRIYVHLYQPVRQRFTKRLQAIITQNSLAHRNGQEWVSYRGKYYSIKKDSPKPRLMNRLNKEFHPVMDEYLKDLDKLNNTELPYVLGYINQVLNSSGSLQDYFQLLPESIHQPIQDLVDACACRTPRLKPEDIQQIQERNKLPIELMKQRMVLNLIS